MKQGSHTILRASSAARLSFVFKKSSLHEQSFCLRTRLFNSFFQQMYRSRLRLYKGISFSIVTGLFPMKQGSPTILRASSAARLSFVFKKRSALHKQSFCLPTRLFNSFFQQRYRCRLRLYKGISFSIVTGRLPMKQGSPTILRASSAARLSFVFKKRSALYKQSFCLRTRLYCRYKKIWQLPTLPFSQYHRRGRA